MGRRHAKYFKVTPEMYDFVGVALLYTLEKGLPGIWNNELKEAWTVVYGILSTTMINAGEEKQQKVREEGKQMLEKTTI